MLPDFHSFGPNPEINVGRKQTNQHTIAPVESGVTADEHVFEEDQQKVEATKVRGESKHIPERKTNPALQGVRDRNDKRGE
jgi:hypothetical protein